MSYYDTGYDYGGYPVYVGTGFDEAWYMGFPPLSYVHQYGAITERDRIEISSRDLIGHAVVYQGMNWGATYALRKGFLDASLMGYMHAGRLYGNMSMAMRMTARAGAYQFARNIASPVGAGLLTVAGAYLLDSFYDWLNPDIDILPTVDFMRFTRFG